MDKIFYFLANIIFNLFLQKKFHYFYSIYILCFKCIQTLYGDDWFLKNKVQCYVLNSIGNYTDIFSVYYTHIQHLKNLEASLTEQNLECEKRLISLQSLLSEIKKVNITAITVSVNYSDLLQVCIEKNYTFFEKWYIVTDINDTKTQELCNKYKNIILLYFNFTENGNIFNKGGGLKLAQTYAHTFHPNNYFLIIDSDICLPKNFKDIIESQPYKNQTVYCAQRNIYKNLNCFLNQEILATDNRLFLGFFQFYKGRYFYSDSFDASKCDEQFVTLFKDRYTIPHLCVDHIGLPDLNWQGRRIFN